MGKSPSFSNLYSNLLEASGTNEYADAGDHSAFSFGNGLGTDTPFTLVIGFKRDALGGNNNLISKFSTGATEYDFTITSANVLRGVCWTSGSTAFIGRTAPMTTIGSWLFGAMTYDASKASSGVKLWSFTAGGSVTQIDTSNLASGVYSTNGMSNTATSFKIGAVVSAGWYFDGKLYHPQVYNIALSSSQLGEIAANVHKDVRTHSFGANAVSAWKYNNGTADYPTWTDYVGGRNATMTNQQDTDINTDIP